MAEFFPEERGEGFLPRREWYKPLVGLGLLKEGEAILSDPFYDPEAVQFALKILQSLGEV